MTTYAKQSGRGQLMLPTFFIIGAAKSGTSSVHDYLGQHPDVFMSPVKEPNFFSFMDHLPDYAGSDMSPHHGLLKDRLKREKYGFSITEWDTYCELFAGANRKYAIGESSVSYMYFPEAAHRIKQHVPGAQLIAILRNPVDRAYSKYCQFIRDAAEPLNSFDSALNAEATRKAASWSPTWFYVDRGKYYRQLKIYYDLFDRSQIRVFLYEDLMTDPNGLCERIFDFIHVDSSLLVDTSVKRNVSSDRQIPRNILLYDLLTRPNPLSELANRALPRRSTRRIRSFVRQCIMKKSDTPSFDAVSDATRQKLIGIFQEDIEQLQGLIDRDLSAWL